MVNKEEQKAWWRVEFIVESGQEDMASWLMMQQGALGCEIENAGMGAAIGSISSGGPRSATKAASPSATTAASPSAARKAESVAESAKQTSPGAPAARRLDATTQSATWSGEGSRIRATFELNTLPSGDTTPLSAALEEYGLSASITTLRVGELHEEDWLAKWKEGFVPFPVGERLLVCPAWLSDSLSAEQRKNRAVILIEPGLAFGTGFHDTTRFCLSALEHYVDKAKEILDVGTGSGILSIGTALLSDHAHIIALETDPLACKVAAENFELNHVTRRISLIEGSTEQLKSEHHKRYDLILSNLTYEDNAALLGEYINLIRPGSHLIFAGILREKLDLMLAALAKHNLKAIREEKTDMWVGLVAEPT